MNKKWHVCVWDTCRVQIPPSDDWAFCGEDHHAKWHRFYKRNPAAAYDMIRSKSWVDQSDVPVTHVTW